MAKTTPFKEVPLAGYANKLSARPGETIEFKVSASVASEKIGGTAQAHLVQSICADCNPAGPGIIERAADHWFKDHSFTVRHQPFFAGSYGVSDRTAKLADASVVTLQATVWPTLPTAGTQVVLSCGNLALAIDEHGYPMCQVQNNSVATNTILTSHQWVQLTAVLDIKNREIRISSHSIEGALLASATAVLTAEISADALTPDSPIVIAARQRNDIIEQHFNGKIEAPRLETLSDSGANSVVIDWDFSQGISSTRIHDRSPNALHGTLVNLPARAMTGANWQGAEMCWRHAPEDYAAIHFHADDIVEFSWETDFTFTVPEEMPSGIYVMRIRAGEYEDAIPFYVCPPKNKTVHKLCVVIPTFTYAVYGNHARPDWTPDWKERNTQWGAYPWNPAEFPAYGQSTYNFHSDGSGICHASHERPLFNLRPGYITFGNSDCSGLRHFQADSHLISWLDKLDIGFDIITDRELHNEGVSCLAQYDAVMTCSHPEYHTPESLNAFTDYRDQGGNLMYLGGNGFYWRIALHPENPHIIEIRRAEDGIRAWAAEPGEYYQAFDGGYGGLWRRNGKPPQALCGVGFSAQGQFNGSYYRKKSLGPDLAWVFDGIDEDTIGDFGLSGGGAAGFELDRADLRLGTPAHAVVLASSENHSDDFILVPEEMLTHLTTVPGPPADELIHADLLWFETPSGGSVFSVGSITFCGSLPHNSFDNNVSTLLHNIVKRMLA